MRKDHLQYTIPINKLEGTFIPLESVLCNLLASGCNINTGFFEVVKFLSIIEVIRVRLGFDELPIKLNEKKSSTFNYNFPSLTDLEKPIQRYIPKNIPEIPEELLEKWKLLVTRKDDQHFKYLLAVAEIFAHGSWCEFMTILAYLSRKKIDIALPSQWPIPSNILHDKTDPVWFLWGLLMHIYPKNARGILLTKFKIFTWNWKGRDTKNQRLPLLIMLHPDFGKEKLEEIEFSIQEVQWMEKMVYQAQNLFETSLSSIVTGNQSKTPNKETNRITHHNISISDPPSIGGDAVPVYQSHNQYNPIPERPYLKEIFEEEKLQKEALSYVTKNINNPKKGGDPVLDASLNRWKSEKFFMEYIPRSKSSQDPFFIHEKNDANDKYFPSVKSITLG